MNTVLAGERLLRAERWAAPEPARLAMCLPVNPASIAVPSGDRLRYSADEGST